MVAKNVISILQKEGVLSKEALTRFRDFERQKNGNVLDFVASEHLADPNRYIPLLRDGYRVPVIDLATADINSESGTLLPKELCLEHALIVFNHDEKNVWVAMADPDNRDLLRFIERQTKRTVIPFLSDRASILSRISQAASPSAEYDAEAIRALVAVAKENGLTAEQMAKETTIVDLLTRLIRYGLKRSASDMHVEPGADHVVIRYRIDGLLHELFSLPSELLAPVIARIKILSRMRIDEHLRPQDGRFTMSDQDYDVAVRVSIIPTLYGQKAALRFLDAASAKFTLASIGFSPAHLERLRAVLGASHGLILVTGPTGSGKTSTLYGMVTALQERSVNISTIEDPIEYHVSGVNQIQVNPQVGLDFSDGLRSILRQDPDIIFVGEIRDRETAQIAINAALTGHLVLSSLHTNSASSAIPRLIDMGIEPYLISSTLRAVVGQRLVRTICQQCKAMVTTEEVPEVLAAPLRKIPEIAQQHALSFAEGEGCELCLGTGYIGRTGIFELLVLDPTYHDVIMQRANSQMIQEHAVQRGMMTIADDAARRIIQRDTTPAEVARVLTI